MAEMTIRAATNADINLVHEQLRDVIMTSPHYSDRFKEHEAGRLDKSFLRGLMAIDPWHIMLMCADGVPGGAMVSGPDCGSIFRYWSWVFPSHRQSRLGMFGMRAFDEHWDNGRFHKAYTFVRPENEVARKLLARYGYQETALMKQHIFGQDYLLIEKFYNRQDVPYDSGYQGRLARLKKAVKGIVERA
ncbi:MAG: GNAT family N-acetyltransferase [Phyllobacteriaceae bacterium]|nr:GNAT family N-acetyltransferase [Phyllobacteriaceae bacterium]